MEVKLAAGSTKFTNFNIQIVASAAGDINFTDFNIQIVASAAGARHGGEICRGERQTSSTLPLKEIEMELLHAYARRLQVY